MSTQREKWQRFRMVMEDSPLAEADDVLELLDDLDAAAEALIDLRLLAGAAGRMNEAEAHLTSRGFAYPFTGYRASRDIPTGTGS